MTNRDATSKDRNRSRGRAAIPAGTRLEPPNRFARTDGRFDLPVVAGRSPQQVARRLA
jgi:hypothetical protein